MIWEDNRLYHRFHNLKAKNFPFSLSFVQSATKESETKEKTPSLTQVLLTFFLHDEKESKQRKNRFRNLSESKLDILSSEAQSQRWILSAQLIRKIIV